MPKAAKKEEIVEEQTQTEGAAVVEAPTEGETQPTAETPVVDPASEETPPADPEVAVTPEETGPDVVLTGPALVISSTPEAGVQVPEGFALVPIKPTKNQIAAGMRFGSVTVVMSAYDVMVRQAIKDSAN